jgi:hypothetical protein
MPVQYSPNPSFNRHHRHHESGAARSTLDPSPEWTQSHLSALYSVHLVRPCPSPRATQGSFLISQACSPARHISRRTRSRVRALPTTQPITPSEVTYRISLTLSVASMVLQETPHPKPRLASRFPNRGIKRIRPSAPHDKPTPRQSRTPDGARGAITNVSHSLYCTDRGTRPMMPFGCSPADGWRSWRRGVKGLDAT